MTLPSPLESLPLSDDLNAPNMMYIFLVITDEEARQTQKEMMQAKDKIRQNKIAPRNKKRSLTTNTGRPD